MKSQARVVIIGGGIAGCSTLYHLTQAGWTDVVLVERDELTSGTTWHSAAQVTNFGAVQTMVGLKSHSIRLYGELAADPDFPITYHHGDGGIRLAATRDHMDGYAHFASLAKGMGVEFEVIDAAECAHRHPLIETHELLGGLWDPLDGDIDPAQLTQALARRARAAGAEVYRHTPVERLTQTKTDEWIVHTSKGDIACEIVVNAGGYRVNEIGAMMGVTHPVVSMEHQYFLTEPIPALEALDHRVPLLRDPLDDFYSRQEKKGLLVGIYEQGCKTWGMDGIDPNFTSALCPNDLDRCLDNVERVFQRMPCLAETGIHTVINGPITYSADGLPLVGPIPGKRNAYCIIGLRAGIGEGGGHGKILAEIITEGESEWDTWCLDPRRFTDHCTLDYTANKAIEDYRNEFRFHMPHEHRPAGRQAKTTTLYEHLAEAHAEFGVVNGWERALFFKPSGDFVDEHSFRFTPTKAVVAVEVAAVRQAVGLMEVSGFTRFEVSGPDAASWLDGLYVSRLPKVGRVGLTYSVTEKGNVLSEATIARLGEDRFWIGVAAAAEHHDRDWLTARLPASGVEIVNLTASHTTIVIAGPQSAALLSDVSNGAESPWLAAALLTVAGRETIAMGLSFSGEAAVELHVANDDLVHIWRALEAAGARFDLKRFGLYATESMRLEKGFRHWKADLITEFTPYEAGLGRFVHLNKGEFEGREVLQGLAHAPHRKRFVVMTIDADHAPAQAGDTILAEGHVTGSVTSAGWGHRVERNIAFGYVSPEHAGPGTDLAVEIIGAAAPATVTEECLYDPQYALLRR